MTISRRAFLASSAVAVVANRVPTSAAAERAAPLRTGDFDPWLELARAGTRLAAYATRDRDRLVGMARALGRPVRIHIYVDTGMHRMGMPHDQVLPWLDDPALRRAIVVDGAFSELTEDQDFDRE